jgi:hypothetical protein
MKSCLPGYYKKYMTTSHLNPVQEKRPIKRSRNAQYHHIFQALTCGRGYVMYRHAVAAGAGGGGLFGRVLV